MCFTLYMAIRNAFQNAEGFVVAALCILLYLIHILSVCSNKLSSINSPSMEIKKIQTQEMQQELHRESVVEIPPKFPNFLILNKLNSSFAKIWKLNENIEVKFSRRESPNVNEKAIQRGRLICLQNYMFKKYCDSI